jgi:hypothetical protein
MPVDLFHKYRDLIVKESYNGGFKYSVNMDVRDINGVLRNIEVAWFSTIDKDEVIDPDEIDIDKRYDWNFLIQTLKSFIQNKWVYLPNGSVMRIRELR